MTAPVLLAIETSTEIMSVAVLVRDAHDPTRPPEVFVTREHTGAASSQAVLPAIGALLAQAGVGLRDCGAVAFGAGPGSFTGLRTAAGIAQGLAFGLGCPVVPVSALEACAQSARAQDPTADHVLAALDARMNEVYWCEFVWTGAGWEALAQAAVSPPARVRPRAASYVLAGNAAAVFGAALEAASGARRIAGDALPDAAHIATLALPRWRAGQGLPAHCAAPAYVRNTVAQTTAEREAARARLDVAGAV